MDTDKERQTICDHLRRDSYRVSDFEGACLTCLQALDEIDRLNVKLIKCGITRVDIEAKLNNEIDRLKAELNDAHRELFMLECQTGETVNQPKEYDAWDDGEHGPEDMECQ